MLHDIYVDLNEINMILDLNFKKCLVILLLFLFE